MDSTLFVLSRDLIEEKQLSQVTAAPAAILLYSCLTVLGQTFDPFGHDDDSTKGFELGTENNLLS